jgi:hypothetical protein
MTGCRWGTLVEQSQVVYDFTPHAHVQVDSASLKAGFDNLATANQQLTDDATGNKACFDIQKAAYDRLQVRAPDMKHGQVITDNTRCNGNAGGFSVAPNGL